MVFANDRIHYGLQVVFVCLQITPSHYHHYADSSEGIELIKCLSGICCRVFVYDWDYSRNYIYFNIWGCVSSAYPIRLSWLRECVLYLIIIIKSEVWIVNHCLGLGHETMVCAVCLNMFFFFLACDSSAETSHVVWFRPYESHVPTYHVFVMAVLWPKTKRVYKR